MKITRLLLLLLPLHHHCRHHCCCCCFYYHCFWCCCLYCIQMRFSFSKQTIVKLVWMSLIALQTSISRSVFSICVRYRVQYAYTKNQPSRKLLCTIFPLNFSLLHAVSTVAKALHPLSQSPLKNAFLFPMPFEYESEKKTFTSFFITDFFSCLKHVQTPAEHSILCHVHRVCYPTRIEFDLNFSLSGN